MTTVQCDVGTISESELNQISAGRSCDQGGTRTEVSVPFGDRTLVIYAYSGTNGRRGCSGAYYQ